MKKTRYFLEAILLYTLFFMFRMLPVDMASDLGGFLGRNIGSRLAASRKARRHLRKAMPGFEPERQRQIIMEMWDNLGRVIAEYPHLEYIGRHRTTIAGEDFLNEIYESETGAVFCGGHLGNWEVNATALLMQHGKEIDMTYRGPNNPWSDRLLMSARSLRGKLRTYPKSREGGREILEAIKQHRYIGILIDQKYNEGVAVDFFGMEAMTNPIFVQLCQKYKCPLIPIRNIRTKGANFILEAHESLPLFDGDKPLPVEDVIQSAHLLLEDWIAKHPGQWLWLHRRWDSESLKSN